MPNTSIPKYVQDIAKKGGMAMSNGFAVKFDMSTKLKKYIDSVVTNADIYEGFCDEAQLPPSQAATGQLQGRLLGEGSISYAHTKLYTDVQLGWMCDANMEPFKFVNAWWQFIFAEYQPGAGEGEAIDEDGYAPGTTGASFGKMMSSEWKNKGRTTRVRYPDDYTATVRIAKVERGFNSATERVSEVHVLQDAYPYTVESIPLSFGASQITKATATFHYTKHHVIYNDIADWGWNNCVPSMDTDDPEFGDFGQKTVNGWSRGQ